MKILIDISDSDYEKIRKAYWYDGKDTILDRMYLAIKHGTRLPESHGRVIDADKIIKYWKPDHHRQFDADYFIHTLEVADTIIEADKEAEE